MTTRFVDPTLLSDTEPLTLLGGHCTACGTTTFPVQDSCPRCFRQEMVHRPLPTTGIVWSWTAQHFAPKAPYRASSAGFTPYLLGYVDLGVVIVESRLVGSADDPPAIGDPVQLVALPAFTDDDGTEVLTFAFTRTGEHP